MLNLVFNRAMMNLAKNGDDSSLYFLITTCFCLIKNKIPLVLIFRE